MWWSNGSTSLLRKKIEGFLAVKWFYYGDSWVTNSCFLTSFPGLLTVQFAIALPILRLKRSKTRWWGRSGIEAVFLSLVWLVRPHAGLAETGNLTPRLLVTYSASFPDYSTVCKQYVSKVRTCLGMCLGTYNSLTEFIQLCCFWSKSRVDWAGDCSEMFVKRYMGGCCLGYNATYLRTSVSLYYYACWSYKLCLAFTQSMHKQFWQFQKFHFGPLIGKNILAP